MRFSATYIKYILIQAIPVCYFKVSVEIIREKAKKLVQTTHDGAERNFLSPCFFFLVHVHRAFIAARGNHRFQLEARRRQERA